MRLRSFVRVACLLTSQLVLGRAVEEASSSECSSTPTPSASSITDQIPADQWRKERAAKGLPTCGEMKGTSDSRSIGYWQSSSYNNSARKRPPGEFETYWLSHVNYAFAVVGEDHRIAATNSWDPEQYVRLSEEKSQRPTLKVFISLRVMAANGALWSDMVQTAAGRTTFVESVLAFMDTFAFDGIDLYWEEDLSEKTQAKQHEDMENAIALIKELRAATFGIRQISIAFPATLAILETIDIAAMARYVDWFNVMSPGHLEPRPANGDRKVTKVSPHSNLTEVNEVLDHVMLSGVKPRQLVLGLTLYGGSFKLEDPDCNDTTCSSEGCSEPGQFSPQPGILSHAEISQILNDTDAVPKLDRDAVVKYISQNKQWISYDDEETWEMKKRFANDRCLSGTAIWSADMDHRESLSSLPDLYILSTKHSIILNRPEVPVRYFNRRNVIRRIQLQNIAPDTVILTECGLWPECPAGYRQLTTAHGVWSQFEVFAQGCNDPPRKDREFYSRAMCIPDNIEAHGCSWVGQPPFCGTGCPRGTVELALNNGPPGSFPPQLCYPYFWSAFCCDDVRLTDQPQFCDDFDPGSLFLYGTGPGSLGNAAVSSREALRMAQIVSSNSMKQLARLDSVVNSFDICSNERRGLPRHGQNGCD